MDVCVCNGPNSGEENGVDVRCSCRTACNAVVYEPCYALPVESFQKPESV